MPIMSKKTLAAAPAAAAPAASPIKEKATKPVEEEHEEEMEEHEEVNITEKLLEQMKKLDTADLFKVMKAALADAEKRAKSSKGKAAEEKKTSKKGKATPQLDKPRAWVNWVLQYGLANGWESFTITQKKKGSDEYEEIEMPASEMNEDGAYIYEGSVTEKEPKGKQITLKHAMSLSKQYWSPKAKMGSQEDLYEQFEGEYVAPAHDEDDKSVATATSSKKVVRMTAADKEAEKAAKEAAAAAKKAEEKAAKEAAKAEKKAAADAAAAAEKEKKKAEKAAAATAAGKGKASKMPVPAAAAKKASSAASVASAEKPAAAKKAVAKKEDWSCPNDGMVHPWAYKGKKYARNFDNQVWEMEEDGGIGEWAGVYDVKQEKIDDSVPEPEFEDDE
jgi:hypothetical protein